MIWYDVQEKQTAWRKRISDLEKSERISLARELDKVRRGWGVKIEEFDNSPRKIEELEDKEIERFLISTSEKVLQPEGGTIVGSLSNNYNQTLFIHIGVLIVVSALATLAPGRFERWLNPKVRKFVNGLERRLADRRNQLERQEAERRDQFKAKVNEAVTTALRSYADREQNLLRREEDLKDREKKFDFAFAKFNRESQQVAIQAGETEERLKRREVELNQLEAELLKLIDTSSDAEAKLNELRALVDLVGPRLIEAVANSPIARNVLAQES